MDKKIDEYIEKQKSPQKEICRYLRKLIHKTLSNVKEEMRWGVPVFANGKFYIGSLRNDVNLGFAINDLNNKEVALFEGNSKTMRHIKIAEIKDIDNKKIIKLLKLVNKKAKCVDPC